ncbi:hypothetical protein AB0E70_12925 [Streptomyces murinus]|nr:hypothetical protein [Streptomyces murinus]
MAPPVSQSARPAPGGGAGTATARAQRAVRVRQLTGAGFRDAPAPAA